MMRVFVTKEGGLREKKRLVGGSWVELVDPSEKEKEKVAKKFKIPREAIEYPLDFAEKPRVEEEESYRLIVLRAPFHEKEGDVLRTIPIGVLFVKNAIITVCRERLPLLEEFEKGLVRDLYTNKRTRFLFQIFQRVMGDYITKLERMEDEVEEVEEKMLESPSNQHLKKVLKKRKALTYFNKAILANGRVLDKLLSGRVIRLFEEDKDLLEDVIIENEQALEMSSTEISLLTGIMETYSSLIDNNLNYVMRVLTSVTIILSVPALIGSFWGMNVPVPFQHAADGFSITLSLAIGLAVATALLFYRVGWL